jgi:hypothetical protein
MFENIRERHIITQGIQILTHIFGDEGMSECSESREVDMLWIAI